jgi:hypothetical protein
MGEDILGYTRGKRPFAALRQFVRCWGIMRRAADVAAHSCS